MLDSSHWGMPQSLAVTVPHLDPGRNRSKGQGSRARHGHQQAFSKCHQSPGEGRSTQAQPSQQGMTCSSDPLSPGQGFGKPQRTGPF
ncbi:hypothetical protein MC885_017089 [Smutsia gigantea]|nr:hypothetical protein MC885_017089 [Smutsia gigantea]